MSEGVRGSVKSALLVGFALGLVGCAAAPPPEPSYETKLSPSALQQAKRDCAYDAEKATAAIKPGYAHYSWTRIYVMCLDLRGVTYSGPM
jgi:hypothetical protein